MIGEVWQIVKPVKEMSGLWVKKGIDQNQPELYTLVKFSNQSDDRLGINAVIMMAGDEYET
jgi:hypothetical protein